ncbi:MAG: hypothetical protein ACI8T1_005423 [Verrucomicrobiales bacterium]|jgi:hypothetical protein
MMVHNVYFWLKEEAKAQSETFETALAELVKISEIQEAKFGKPATTVERPVTDHSYSYSLILTFATQADHDVYQDHTDHHVFVNQCKDMWEKVVVYDSEIIG